MTTPQERLELLYKNKKLCDVTLQVKNDGRIYQFKAHKLILAMSSEAFETMFFGSMPENTDKPIELGGIDIQAVNYLLNYCYTGKVQFSSTNEAIVTAYAANVYLMNHLLELCVNYLKQNLSNKNCCHIYESRIFLEDQKLQDSALEIIRNESHKFILHDDFLQLSRSTLEELYEHFTIHVHEKDLFKWLIRWAINEFKKENASKENPQNGFPRKTIRKILGNFLKHFPFRNMTSSEFLEVVGSLNVLENDEVLAIAMTLAKTTYSPLPEWCIQTQTKFPITMQLSNPNMSILTGQSSPFTASCDFKIKPGQTHLRVYLTGFKFYFTGELQKLGIKVSLLERKTLLIKMGAPSLQAPQKALQCHFDWIKGPGNIISCFVSLDHIEKLETSSTYNLEIQSLSAGAGNHVGSGNRNCCMNQELVSKIETIGNQREMGNLSLLITNSGFPATSQNAHSNMQNVYSTYSNMHNGCYDSRQASTGKGIIVEEFSFLAVP